MSAPTIIPTIPANLPRQISITYATALSRGALVFTQTASVTPIPVGPSTFNLRYCPSLANKPTAPNPDTLTVLPNPFLPPFAPLLVASLPGYNIVLNRFPVIAHHFLLCTSEFEPQSTPLRDADVKMIYRVLESWTGDKKLFGFFNCGERSGASQPHRHVQFFPVENSKEMLYDQCPEAPAAPAMEDRRGSRDMSVQPAPWVHPGVPFKSYCFRIKSEDEAVHAYKRLMETAAEILDRNDGSYNLGVTKEWMVLLPRTQAEVNWVGINGTVLAGEVLVKREEEWDMFTDEGALEKALKQIGVPQE
jgi:ATP adenylyltransferase